MAVVAADPASVEEEEGYDEDEGEEDDDEEESSAADFEALVVELRVAPAEVGGVLGGHGGGARSLVVATRRRVEDVGVVNWPWRKQLERVELMKIS